MNPALIENNPEYAQALQGLLDRFERNYDLSKVADRATLVEGVKELSILAAQSSTNGAVKVVVGADGLRQIIVTVDPVPATHFVS